MLLAKFRPKIEAALAWFAIPLDFDACKQFRSPIDGWQVRRYGSVNLYLGAIMPRCLTAKYKGASSNRRASSRPIGLSHMDWTLV